MIRVPVGQIISVLAIAISSALAATERLLPDDPFWKRYLKCGPNSLYMFLLLSNHPEIDPKQLEAIPMTPQGASLLDLKETAKRMNIDAEVRKYTPEEIDSIPVPAIAQFKTGPGSPSSNHFMVIYKADAHRIYVLDGTTGEPTYFARTNLARFWTGVVMAGKPMGPFSANRPTTWLELACWFIAEAALLLIMGRTGIIFERLHDRPVSIETPNERCQNPIN